MRINEILTRDEILDLVAPSDLRGWAAVGTTWAMIAASFALVAWYPAVWTIAIAIVILGGRHLALAILMHDASHYSLFKTRRLNDLVGGWFCAFPTWQDLRRYRGHHWLHHKWAGTEQDPDLDLVLGLPTSRASFARKIFRDLSGISGIKRVYGLLLMDLGFIQYTVSSRVTRLDQSGRGWRDIASSAFRNLRGVAITNLILFAILWACGKPWLYLLWVASYLTVFSLIVRIRSIAEHACTEMDLDPFKSTRSTHANWLARVTVAPHRVNYHLEHHLVMTAPYFNLPRINRLLRERGALVKAHTASGYLEVLRLASSAITQNSNRPTPS